MKFFSMFIYNLSIKIDVAIAEKWIIWMLEKHIPLIMRTGCFEKFQFAKLIGIDDGGSETFVTQYYTNSKADYERYVELYEADSTKQMLKNWGDDFYAFQSLMETLE